MPLFPICRLSELEDDPVKALADIGRAGIDEPPHAIGPALAGDRRPSAQIRWRFDGGEPAIETFHAELQGKSQIPLGGPLHYAPGL